MKLIDQLIQEYQAEYDANYTKVTRRDKLDPDRETWLTGVIEAKDDCLYDFLITLKKIKHNKGV